MLTSNNGGPVPQQQLISMLPKTDRHGPKQTARKAHLNTSMNSAPMALRLASGSVRPFSRASMRSAGVSTCQHGNVICIVAPTRQRQQLLSSCRRMHYCSGCQAELPAGYY